MGDLVVIGALQFSNPPLVSSFDADPKTAAEQRLRVFKMADEGDYWVAGGHLFFPGSAISVRAMVTTPGFRRATRAPISMGPGVAQAFAQELSG
jgi:glyoxylase-like metal-dependent hydrolase (beta-lactamase superfamily II)